MLYAKKYYIDVLLPRMIGSQDFTNGMKQDIIWMHDGFVKQYVQKSERNKTNGVTFYRYPSKYKIDKATAIIRRYGGKPFINGMNGQIDEKITAVFYYAALLLDYCDTSPGPVEFTITQRYDVEKAREVALAGMEKDHKDRMARNLGIIDTLVDTLADENAERRLLKVGWKRHMETQ